MAEIKISWWSNKCWRKSISVNGKQIWKYYYYPNTSRGRDQAIQAFLRDKEELTGKRTITYHKEELSKVISYLNRFDKQNILLPHLKILEETLEIPNEIKREVEFLKTNPIDSVVFMVEWGRDLALVIGNNWMTDNWKLPEDWQEKTRAIGNPNVDDKKVFTWIQRYKLSKQNGNLRASSVYSAINHINTLERYVHPQTELKDIDNQYVAKYEDYIDKMNISRSTKKSYFSGFQQFLVYLDLQDIPDFRIPKSAQIKKSRFNNTEVKVSRMDKREMLWTPEDFKKALQEVPERQQLWILLGLNCGFRNVDLGHLNWDQLTGNRLINKRRKLRRFENAPTINFKLWDKTMELINKLPRDSDLMLLSDRGLPLINEEAEVKGILRPQDRVADWWDGNKRKYNLKRMDYLRKTGATFVGSVDMNLRRTYLAETLTSVEDIHYTFLDGEINEKLDNVTDLMEKHFIG